MQPHTDTPAITDNTAYAAQTKNIFTKSIARSHGAISYSGWAALSSNGIEAMQVCLLLLTPNLLGKDFQEFIEAAVHNTD